MAPDARTDRDLLLEAAREAGEIALHHFRSDLAVLEKPAGQGPVTEADHAVDDFLRRALGEARPGYGWLSEETEDSEARLGKDRVFVVDPIDGTRAFIAGDTGWSISLAVVAGDRPVAGVIHLPARGETYCAALGEGAALGGRAIRPSGRTVLEGARVLTPKSQLAPENWPGGVPPIERAFRSSLAWRFCLVAEGSFDAMLTLRDCWEWDIAAGTLIAAEAGSTVTDRDGLPLRFNAQPPRAHGAVVAPPALHSALMARRSAAHPD